jgi:hypothetical protein
MVLQRCCGAAVNVKFKPVKEGTDEEEAGQSREDMEVRGQRLAPVERVPVCC